MLESPPPRGLIPPPRDVVSIAKTAGFRGVMVLACALSWACSDLASRPPTPIEPIDGSADVGPSESASPTAGEPLGSATTDAVPRRDPQPTGARPFARVVWLRDVGEGTNIIGHGDDPMILMGAEVGATRDAPVSGERRILAEAARYAKPLLAPSGEEVVFSNRELQAVFSVRWDGSNTRRVADGAVLATWQDPTTAIEWVYVGSDTMPSDTSSHRVVRRYQLEDPEVNELVWDARPVFEHSFQLSRDGRYGAGQFTWPDAGFADLQTGQWVQVGEGCWTAMASGERPMMWYFDGSHRNVTMVDLSTEERWTVNISGAPGIDGFEVWHPRWSNHPRVLVVTGPYTVGGGTNRIRGGGAQVEVHVGRFDATYRSVEEWIRVTHNNHADFMPDVWVAPDWTPPVSDRAEVYDASARLDRSPGQASSTVVLTARAVRSAVVPTPRDILPYRHALVAIPFEVLEVVEGTYEFPTVLVAWWAIRDGEILPDAARSAGSIRQLTLGRYDDHPELEGQRLLMQTDDYTLPLYYDSDR